MRGARCREKSRERPRRCGRYPLGHRKVPPSETVPSLRKKRPYIGRNEADDVERVVDTGGDGLASNIVTVVERHRSPLLERQHRAHMIRHRTHRLPRIAFRIVHAQSERLFVAHSVRYVAVQLVMRRGLIRQHIRRQVTGDELGEEVGRVADIPDRERLFPPYRLVAPPEGFIEIRAHAVQIGRLEPSLDPTRGLLQQRDRRRRSS